MKITVELIDDEPTNLLLLIRMGDRLVADLESIGESILAGECKKDIDALFFKFYKLIREALT